MALQWLIGILLTFAFLGMVLGPPASLVWETIDMVRMRDQTTGWVDTISTKSGSHGTSRAVIEYHFSVNQREVQSTRYAPGFVANWGRWTGGARVARDFPVGQPVTVYFSAKQPQRCALEYGWFSWSVALTMIFAGATLAAVGDCSSKSVARWTLGYGGRACFVYGFALLFVGPPVVRVRDLGWHALGWGGALLIAILRTWYLGRRQAIPISNAETFGG